MRFPVLFLIIVLSLSCACSKSAPLEPSLPLYDCSQHTPVTSGIIELDPVTKSICQVEDRISDFHYNVTGLLAVGCPGGCFRWRILSWVGEILTIELTLENPTTLQVYDARLVFTNLGGKIVENADNYTDVFSPNVWHSFIAFSKSDPTRAFPIGPGGIDIQEMVLRWPDGAGALVVYFIEVSLGGNCAEPYLIHDQRQIGKLDPMGGNARIHVEVSDHQDNVSEVVVDTSLITGGFTFLNKVSGEIWEANISNTMGAPVGFYSCLIRAASTGDNAKLYDYVELVVTEPADPAWNSFGGNCRNTGRTSTIGPQTNRVHWWNNHTITGDYHTIGAPVIDSDGDVYYHVTPNPTDGLFCKVDGDDGGIIWTHDPDDDDGGTLFKETYSVPALDEDLGYIYYALLEGVWCVEMETGNYVNHFPVSSQNEGSSPMVGPNYVYFGYAEESMYARTHGLFSHRYAYDYGDGFSCAPAVDDSGNAFFPSLGTDRKFHGLTSNGTEIFPPITLSAEAIRLVSAAIDDDGTIYYQPASYRVYAINPDGSIKWNCFLAVPNSYFTSPAIGHGNYVYVFREQILYAVNKTSGDDDWSHVVGKYCMTPVVDGNDTLYFLTYDGVIRAFNTISKTEIWTYNTGRPLYSVPVYRYPASGALGPDGLLVFMGNAGVWAFKDA